MAITFAGVSAQTVEYVDLGLSVKWADRNVGANSPSDCGGYFAWGALTESQQNAQVRFDIGGTQYDVATAKWGSGWRIPTLEELVELKDKCTWKWTSQGGHNGYRVTGPNGNSIFLPAAGYHSTISSKIYEEGSNGFYWSSIPGGGTNYIAMLIVFTRDSWNYTWRFCNEKYSIRPVYDTASAQTVEYVDLGLSVKWADRNVGASNPSDYGDMLEWGAFEEFQHYAEVDFNITGNPQYDAATAKWGSGWRIPTLEELVELKDKCTWKWTSQGGHNGYRVTGPNGNSIFLPAAGRRSGSECYSVGDYGCYWSSTPHESFSSASYYLNFSRDRDRNRNMRNIDWFICSSGGSVRPVCD